jgi:hypothetical protein
MMKDDELLFDGLFLLEAQLSRHVTRGFQMPRVKWKGKGKSNCGQPQLPSRLQEAISCVHHPCFNILMLL